MKKKRVKVYMPKAQEGMEMAQGSPEGGQQGGDPMQELAMQVQQMLEQGAAPEQVVAQLLQGGVPPEAIMQVMVSMGMPQEQVQPLIEGVMQQMQGAQGQQDPQGEQQGQEASPEGQPMMQDGDEVSNAPVLNTETGMYEFVDPNTGQVMVTNPVDAPEYVDRTPFNPYNLPLEEIDGEMRSPFIKRTQPTMKGGGYMKYQGGGENQQQQVEQLIMMFAQLQGVDPQAIMSQLSQAQPEQQQQMLQEMAMAVQQAQGGGQPQQPQMLHGGITTSNPGFMILPDDKDFSAIRKDMLKQYKKGGQTDELDSTSTEAFVQNLNGAISNYVSKNMRVGMIERNYKENMTAFNQLPKAQNGMSDEELKAEQEAQKKANEQRAALVESYSGKSFDDIRKDYITVDDKGNRNISTSDYTAILEKYYPEKLSNYNQQVVDESKNDINQNTTNVANNAPLPGESYPAWMQRTTGAVGGGFAGGQYIGTTWDGSKWVSQGGPSPQHYYPGWGPGMPQGSYGQERFLTTPVGQFMSAFGPRYATGNVQMKGIEGLAGANPAAISQQMMAALQDPSKFQFDVEDVTRKRLFGKDKVIGKRLTWSPITGEPTMTSDGFTGGGQGTTQTMAEVTDESGNVTRMSLEEAEAKGLAHKQVEVPVEVIDPAGMQDYPGEGDHLAINPRTGEQEYTTERRAERWGRKLNRKQDKAVDRNQRGGGRLERLQRKTQEANERAAIAKDNAQIYRNKTERIRKEIMDKYGNVLDKKLHGGITNSNPGFLFIAEDGMDDAEKMGVNIIPEWARNINVGQATGAGMDIVGSITDTIMKGRMMGTPEERRARLSMDYQQTPFTIGSGGKGFYDQEGRFIGTDIGAPTRPGTGTDQDVYGSYTAKNIYGDFTNTGEQFRLGMGGNVLPFLQMGDEVEFTEEEIAELEALGYQITRM